MKLSAVTETLPVQVLEVSVSDITTSAAVPVVSSSIVNVHCLPEAAAPGAVSSSIVSLVSVIVSDIRFDLWVSVVLHEEVRVGLKKLY